MYSVLEKFCFVPVKHCDIHVVYTCSWNSESDKVTPSKVVSGNFSGNRGEMKKK